MFKTVKAFICLLIASSLNAVSTQDAVIEREIIKKPYLYHVRKGDIDFKLLGTYHHIPLGSLCIKAQTEITSCRSLIWEGGFGVVFACPSPKDELIKYGLLDASATMANCWFNNLPKAQQPAVEETYNLFARQFSGIMHATPFAIHEITEKGYFYLSYMNSETLRIIKGMDIELVQIFAGKSTFLDSVDGVMAMTRDDFFKEPIRGGDMLAKAEAAYKKGDEDELYDVILKAHSEAFRNVCIVDRNREWMSRIPEILKLPGFPAPIIAVGVGHLFGSEGLLALLAKDGYTITRSTYDD